MKKRILALAMAAVMAGSLTACSGSSGTDTKAAPAETEAPASESKSEAKEESKAGEGDAANTASSKGGSEGYELALVTDLGTIDDKSFNQGAWEGLKKYAEENSISYKYYQPQEGTTDSYLETIGLAIEGGAKLVVCPGFLFEEPIYLAQDKYPDVHFILLDGEPLSRYGRACPVQMIWQHPELSVNPRLKMREVLCEGDRIPERIVEGLGIERDWLNRYPAELSGGELQRFCIARTLGEKTKFLLADEISTMLDLITQSQIWNFLIKEVSEREIGLLVVSHSEPLLERLCSRIINLWEEG